MRRHVMTAAVLAGLFPAGAVVATTPPAPPGTPQAATTAPAATDTTQAAAAVPATIFDQSGNPVATVTVTGIEPAWTGYEEGDEPEPGREYLRMTVTVEGLIAGWHFNVAIDDFILQANNGLVTIADNVPTAAQAEADEEIIEETDLAISQVVEFALTFEIDPSVGPQSVFYRPDNGRLVDVAEVG